MAKSVAPNVAGVDAYIAGIDPKLRPIAEAARRAIRANGSSLTETVIMGVPCYVGHRQVCYIADYSVHVNLGFHQGARLPDGSGRLEGTGKGLRHLKLRTPGDASS